MKDRKELLEIANNLKLKFPKNISTDKLQMLINEQSSNELGNNNDEGGVQKTEKDSKIQKDKTKSSKKKTKNSGKKKKKNATVKEEGISEEFKELANLAAIKIRGSSDAELFELTTTEKEEIARKSMMNKIRVSIIVHDPAEAKLPSRVIRVRNTHSDTIRCVIDNNPSPQHLPKAVIDLMNEEKYVRYTSYTDPETGVTVDKGSLENKYSISILPPLTKKELDKLAKKQRKQKFEGLEV